MGEGVLIKEYPSSYDRSTKLITVIVAIILVIASCSILISAILVVSKIPEDKRYVALIGATVSFIVLLGTVIWAYANSSYNYILTDKDLTIIKKYGSVTFDVSSITDVRTIQDGMFLRVAGNGGLFGYYGLFWGKGIGMFKVYARNLKQKILIEFDNKKKILISPDDIAMLEDLKETVNKSKLRSV